MSRKSIQMGGLCVALLLGIGLSTGLAGDLDYPRSVQADWRGDYRVVIEAKNTDDPGFQITERENVVANRIEIVRTGQRTWRIVIEGRLINLRRSGSFSFRADPEGHTITGKVLVLAPIDGVRSVEGSLVVRSDLLRGTITCEFTCSDGSKWTMFCGGHDTAAECCELVKKAGCPEGARFKEGKCDGTNC